ncbi:hypothetical protein BZG78_11645 [Salinivibrio sp. MA351]|nr:hypothetical protein BZG78_11645 [Salinivibrio sp. MA351]
MSLDRDKLLIQYADGVVKEEVPLDGSRQQINQTDVPEGGYVTFYIELLDKYFATSIQKKYLKSNDINWLGYEKVDAPNNPRCVTGNNAPATTSYNAISISTDTAPGIIGVATPDSRKLTANPTQSIDIESSFSVGLGVAHQAASGDGEVEIPDSDLDNPREITDYKFFNLSDNATEELDKLIESNSWTAPANTYNLTSAALYADYQQTPYIWQNLPHSASDTITYRYDPDINNLDYFLTAEGSVDASGDQWQLSTAQQLSDTQLSAGLGRTDLADSVTVPQQENANIDGSGTLTAYGNGADGQAGIQRIAYQATESSTTVTHVIYAEANAEQTIPMFDDNGINAVISGADTLSNYDISVMYTSDNTDQRQALAALMAEHTDPGQSDITDLSLDNLPVLFTTYEREQLARQKKIIDHYQISTSNP